MGEWMGEWHGQASGGTAAVAMGGINERTNDQSVDGHGHGLQPSQL
jgi:hypothetical protein